MPLYEYKCKKCNKTFEMLQKINSSPIEVCIYCKGNVEKQISISSFQFKGSGWYITDYKKSNKDKTTESKAKSKTKSKENLSENKNATIK